MQVEIFLLPLLYKHMQIEHINVCFPQDGKMSWTVADAVDYKGFPADKSRTGGWVAAALILGIRSCFRD